MSNWPTGNPYPSIDEFGGLYNIPDQYEDAGPVLRSADDLPEFGFPEFWKVYKAAEKWYSRAMPPISGKPFDPLDEDGFVPWDDADDRTLRVEHGAYNRLTVDFLRRIQSEFFDRFPLWRVHLIGEDADSSIVVYPDAIRFGNQPVGVDPEEALRKLIPKGIATRQQRQRVARAELAVLQRYLPEAVQAIGDSPFWVICTLDSCWLDENCLTLWALVRARDDGAIDIVGPDETDKDFMGGCSGYGVNAKGSIISHIEIPETAAFSVIQRFPPRDYRVPLTIIETATGKRHVYEVKSENIIHLDRAE